MDFKTLLLFFLVCQTFYFFFALASNWQYKLAIKEKETENKVNIVDTVDKKENNQATAVSETAVKAESIEKIEKKTKELNASYKVGSVINFSID